MNQATQTIDGPWREKEGGRTKMSNSRPHQHTIASQLSETQPGTSHMK